MKMYLFQTTYTYGFIATHLYGEFYFRKNTSVIVIEDIIILQ